MKLPLLIIHLGIVSSLALPPNVKQNQLQPPKSNLNIRVQRRAEVEAPESVGERRPAYIPESIEVDEEAPFVIDGPDGITAEIQLAQQNPRGYIITEAARDALDKFRPIYDQMRAAAEENDDESSERYKNMLPKIELVVSYDPDGTTTIRLGPGTEEIDPATTLRDRHEFMMYLDSRPDEQHDELINVYFETHPIAPAAEQDQQLLPEGTESSQGQTIPPGLEPPLYRDDINARPADAPIEELYLPQYNDLLAEGLIEVQVGRPVLSEPYFYRDGSSPYGPIVRPTTERQGITGALQSLAVTAYTRLTPNMVQSTVANVWWGVNTIRDIAAIAADTIRGPPEAHEKRARYLGDPVENGFKRGNPTAAMYYKRGSIVSTITSAESTTSSTSSAAGEFLGYLNAYRSLQSQASSIILPYISSMLNVTTISTLGLPLNLTYLAARSIYVDLTGAPETLSAPFSAGFSGLSSLNEVFFNSTGGVNATLKTILAKKTPNITDVATLRFIMGNERLEQVYFDTFGNASQALLRANITQNMLLLGLSLQTNETDVWPEGFGTKVMPDTLSQYFKPPILKSNTTG